MVNWPYVWNAVRDAVRAGSLAQAIVDDIGWARYPRDEAGRPSRPPLGGIDVAIGAFTQHPQQALRRHAVHHVAGEPDPAHARHRRSGRARGRVRRSRGARSGFPWRR